MDNKNFWSRNKMAFIASELGKVDIHSVIYDLTEVGVLSEELCSASLSTETTKTNIARKIVENIGSLSYDDQINRKIAEVFYKNGLQELAELIDSEFTSSINTRDSSSEIGEKLHTLPDLRSSASFPTLSTVPNSPPFPESSISYHEGLDRSLKKQNNLEINVIPSRYIYGSNDNEEIYRNMSDPRGYMFLANVFKIPSHKDREGSDIDVENLKKLFTQMGYKVFECLNPTKRKLIKELREFSENKELQHVDSCVIAIMSHGSGCGKKIVTADSVTIGDSEIMEYFNNKTCPYLRNKPKIFIFQYCRGTLPDLGVEPDPTLYNVSNENDNEGILIDGINIGETIPITRDTTYSDIYCIYATMEGYVAYLHNGKGSWLVESICTVFMEHAHNTDLDALMKKVSLRIKNNSTNRGRKQIPEYRMIGFNKYFYFNPPILSNACSLNNLDELTYALPTCMSNSSCSTELSVTPPHERRHRMWEFQSRPSSHGPHELQYSGSYSQLRSRHSSGTSTNSRDLSPFSPLVRPKYLGETSQQFQDKRFSFGFMDNTGKENELPSYEVQTPKTEDVVDNLRRVRGTSEDFRAWRLMNAQKAEKESSPYSIKRQLSLPSTREVVNKLTDVTHYLQVHELDHYADALEPIKNEVLKLNKNKKQRNEPSSLDY